MLHTIELFQPPQPAPSSSALGAAGQPDDLLGTALWLLAPTAAYVTGIVVPVGGGFSAYNGI